MIKFTALIKGNETIVNLQQSIITTDHYYVFVKRATVFWEYKNVIKDTELLKNSTKTKTITPGYYTFDTISKMAEEFSVKISKREFDGKCVVRNEGSSAVQIGATKLLGISGFNNRMLGVGPGAEIISDKRVDINSGLRYVKVSCNLVDSLRNVDTDGKISDVITTLHVPTDRTLFGSVMDYDNIDGRIPLVRGAFNQLVFNVNDQDGNPVEVGKILIDLYILHNT